jgi:cytochrome c553
VLKGAAAIFCLSAFLPPVANADALAGKKKAELCVFCHAAREGTTMAPVLEGQPRGYFIAQIRAYQATRRTNAAMVTNAAGLKESDVRDLADFFAAQKLPAYPVFDARRAESGKARLRTLACRSCHGRGYDGEGEVPRLAGQNPKYVAWTLQTIKFRTRLHPMGGAASELESLTDDEIEDLANGFASME